MDANDLPPVRDCDRAICQSAMEAMNLARECGCIVRVRLFTDTCDGDRIAVGPCGLWIVEPAPEPRRYIIEQEADGGYDSVEVCEFRILPCGRVEVASFGGWESTLLTAAEPLDLEALARDVAEEAANGDREIYDPDKDVRVTPVT